MIVYPHIDGFNVVPETELETELMFSWKEMGIFKSTSPIPAEPLGHPKITMRILFVKPTTAE